MIPPAPISLADNGPTGPGKPTNPCLPKLLADFCAAGFPACRFAGFPTRQPSAKLTRPPNLTHHIGMHRRPIPAPKLRGREVFSRPSGAFLFRVGGAAITVHFRHSKIKGVLDWHHHFGIADRKKCCGRPAPSAGWRGRNGDKAVRPGRKRGGARNNGWPSRARGQNKRGRPTPRP